MNLGKRQSEDTAELSIAWTRFQADIMQLGLKRPLLLSLGQILLVVFPAKEHWLNVLEAKIGEAIQGKFIPEMPRITHALAFASHILPSFITKVVGK